MNHQIMKSLGFEDAVMMVKIGNCPCCGKVIDLNDFKDDLSLKEYSISGLCQSCQDEVFKKEEN